MSKEHTKISKERALKMWETNALNKYKSGTCESLQFIHSTLFKGLEGYGDSHIRTSNISKDGFLFASAIYLEEAIRSVVSLPQSTFDKIITKYCEMNIVHPFIEGNGRTMRVCG